MNIARPTERDLEAALELMSILNAVDDGFYPNTNDAAEDGPTFFDSDDKDHLSMFFELVRACMLKSPGYIGRVVGGMHTIMHNDIMDPDKSYLELHPRLIAVKTIYNQPAQFPKEDHHMKNHDNCKKKFIITSQAWYGKSMLTNGQIDKIMFGWYHTDGGTTGELSIAWQDVGGKVVPQLCAWDDSWHALSTFGDVIQSLAALDDANSTPQEVAALLIKCGFEDETERVSPHAESETAERLQLAKLLNKYPDTKRPL